jgi:DNA ligase-1
VTRLLELVEASRRIAETNSRTAKRAVLVDCLRRLQPEEIEIGVALLSGEIRQGKLGAGFAQLRAARGQPPAPAASLTLTEVDAALTGFAAMRGQGSTAKRAAALGALFARATNPEQDFLVRLIAGELRQGALEGLMLDAIAAAATIPAATIRRAAMYARNVGQVARIALTEGAPGLAALRLETLKPVVPMLAQSAQDVNEALQQLHRAEFDWKLDGARVQVHKAGDEVRVYTRNLNDVTDAVPEVIQAARSLPTQDLVLDGETIALHANGAPYPFQATMRRFGRKLDVEALRRELPLAVYFFDCLRRDGDVLVDRPTSERFAALTDLVPEPLVIPHLVTSNPAEAQAFFDAALARGHEGVMAKAADAPYEAGNRGSAWLKIKRAHTLDLVVLAAEWGHGRRQGWLSNLHLGARDPQGGQFVMLGKTFKGLTDALLEWQTHELLAREISRDSYTVYVRPELVVEIAFNDVQASPHYPGGLALRFARVKSYRPDKRADESDTIDTVRALYAAQLAHGAPQ